MNSIRPSSSPAPCAPAPWNSSLISNVPSSVAQPPAPGSVAQRETPAHFCVISRQSRPPSPSRIPTMKSECRHEAAARPPFSWFGLRCSLPVDQGPVRRRAPRGHRVSRCLARHAQCLSSGGREIDGHVLDRTTRRARKRTAVCFGCCGRSTVRRRPCHHRRLVVGSLRFPICVHLVAISQCLQSLHRVQ